MSQFHHLPEPLSGAPNGSNAHWAVSAAGGKAVVFLHGFAGDPVDTWTDFPALLAVDARAQGVDLLFYGYDGKFTQTGSSALEFQNFMEALLGSATTVLPSFLSRGSGFAYRQVVVAAHSLGAVIARRAMLDAWSDGDTWPASVRTVLFAPAHRGAYSAVIASAILSGQDWWLGKIVAGAIAHNTPLLTDLQPDSVVLRGLLDDTNELLRKDPAANFVVAHSVVWSHDEKVVINQRFGRDPKPIKVPGDHKAVCKPRRGFTTPLDVVLAAI